MREALEELGAPERLAALERLDVAGATSLTADDEPPFDCDTLRLADLDADSLPDLDCGLEAVCTVRSALEPDNDTRPELLARLKSLSHPTPFKLRLGTNSAALRSVLLTGPGNGAGP